DDAAGRSEALADDGAAWPGADDIRAAGCFDLHDDGGDLLDGGLDGLFLDLVKVVGAGRGQRAGRKQGNGSPDQGSKSRQHGNNPHGITVSISARAILVPKLRLGTHTAKLRFASTRGALKDSKQSFNVCIPKRSLGTRSVGETPRIVAACLLL